MEDKLITSTEEIIKQGNLGRIITRLRAYSAALEIMTIRGVMCPITEKMFSDTLNTTDDFFVAKYNAVTGEGEESELLHKQRCDRYHEIFCTTPNNK